MRSFPLSAGQKALWFLYRAAPECKSYHVACLTHVRPDIELPRFRESLQGLMDRHAALRTLVRVDGEGVVQDEYEWMAAEIVEHGCDAWPDQELEYAIRTAWHLPFDLERKPPVRVDLFRRGDEGTLMLLTAHHIAMDGWSMWLCLDELCRLYQGEQPNPPRKDYAAFVDEQREMLAGSEGERLRTFWEAEVPAAPLALDLPLDRPRAGDGSDCGRAIPFTLPADLGTGLRELAHESGTTLYTVVLSAFQVFLRRYTGQDRIRIGTPVTGRKGPDFKHTVGYFVNSLVMTGDFTEPVSFREQLRVHHRRVRSALVHQRYPFSQLVESRPESRFDGAAPLFQASLVFQRALDIECHPELFLPWTPGTRPELPGLTVDRVMILQQEDQYDLALEMAESGEDLPGLLKYRSDLFDEETVRGMVECFETLLTQLVHNPDLTPDAIPLEDSACGPHLAGETLDLDESQLVLDALVAGHPNAAAASCDAHTLTYADLHRRANGIAHALRERGIRPDEIVALCLDRSPEMAAVLLGVLKAGAAYLPLDPSLPTKRLAFMVEDARPVLLIVDDTHAPHFADLGVPLLPDEDRRRDEDSPPVRAHTPSNLAYVMYTSGSTGTPKAVSMPHRAVANLLAWQCRHTAIADGARTLQFTSLSFDVSVQEFFFTWATGGTLVLVRDGVERDMARLARLLVDEEIERLFLPFVALQHLATEMGERNLYPPRLKEVVTAGEQLQITPAVVNLFQRLDGALLRNQYGPTETHVVTEFVLDGDPTTWPNLPPIGRPVANTRIHLRDDRGHPVPRGVVGELYVGGPALAREYLRRPELTRERFPQDSSPGGERLFRTGDLARLDARGDLEFLGRRDNQVKIRGYRVEPGEIESVLREDPGVADARVTAWDAGKGRKRLVAYLVPAPGERPSWDELRVRLERRLPRYMVPTDHRWLDAFPLTPTGKVDLRALPEPAELATSAPAPGTGLDTAVEETLAGIWADVLDLPSVGPTDDFFERGGHSLLATQVVSRIRRALDVDLPLKALFETPTLRGLAGTVQARREEAVHAPQAPPITRAPASAVPPLSFSQERMWFLHQFDPEGAAYNMGLAIHLEGEFDRKAAEQSLIRIARRHENLRTRFPAQDGRPVIVVDADPRLGIRFEDLSTLPTAERLSTAREVAEAEIMEPFDLDQGPLFRATIYRLADDDHVVLFCLHHIIADLWTFGVLFEELAEIYDALRHDREPKLEPLTLQYTDYAHWQRQWFRGEVLNRQLDYWRKQLLGVKVLSLPTDRPRPTVLGNRGAIESISLPPECIQRLKEVSAAESVTPYMMLLAVFKVLLMRYSGQEDIAVGSPVAGRTRLEVEGLTGTFVNTLVMRTHLTRTTTFRELLESVRETTLAAFEHQDLPFEKLVEDLQPERDMSHPPLVQVLFNLANAPFQSPPIRDLAWKPMELERGAAQFELSLFGDLEITGRLFLEYNTDLFDATTATRFLRQFQAALEAVLERSDWTVGEVPLLPEEERSRMLREWNATERSFPNGRPFSRLFEETAGAHPHAIAVVHDEEHVTYGDLNRDANRIAAYLADQGAKPGVVVGILMERSLRMVTALLGIMKSGAAYLPLDPGFPDDRLAFMVQDAAAKILVTEEELRDRVPATGAAVVTVDGQAADIAACATEDPPAAARPGDPAYVIHTSGSTGRPKGVVVPHRALVNLLCSMAERPGCTAEDTLLAVTTLSFDIAGLELYLPLLVGGRVVLADRATAYDPVRLAQLIEESEATVMQATPATWRMLIDSGWKGRDALRILCGGEALPRDLANALGERCASLWNMYGPTETTIWSSVSEVEPGRPVHIGRPIANTQIYLLDPDLQPVPIGVPGELHIGGTGLADGYHDRPELTARQFIPNPFADDPAARLYKTGDLARFLPDGTIECLGRIDNQVKIRGFRIELGEIESALATHPAVQTTVVVARDEGNGIKGLAAYIVPRGEDPPTMAELRAHLRQSLPDYMIPTGLAVLDQLPLTPNNKVDRKALPAPTSISPTRDDSFVAPRTPVEQELARVWSEVLGVEQVGVHDDFFELGGHSLLATQLAARMRELLTLDFPLRGLFLHPTIEELASRIVFSAEDNRYVYYDDEPQWSSLMPMQTRGDHPPFFLVSGTYAAEDAFLGYMANLVPHLGHEQPIYGFKARGLDGAEEPHASAEEMAREYVAELRTLQPEGPYYLGGECVGGVVAFEMAQQLIAAGERVAFLVLMDTIRPTFWTSTVFHLGHLKRRVRSVGRNLGRIFQPDLRRGLHHLDWLMRRKRKLHLPRNEQERVEGRIYRIERAYAKLMYRYRAETYPGRLTLLVNEEQHAGNPSLGWRGLSQGGLTILTVPGDHMTRITAHVKETAARLRTGLDEALREEA